MGVLIKGMDMPKGCVDPKSKGMACPVLLWCTAWRDKVAPPLHRPQDCPLVEVPTPHGRLIDADKLHDEMYHRTFETDGDTMWQIGCWVRYRAIEQVQNGMPAVIEAEE